ncbi:MAG: 16S rRNA (cytidine(1402)-2'-O)-methyltransferase [Sedimentisphaerales bacterium]|nr:16S rRNA (cytidine(1402)-2'-O)-methyltransferase [Sedimentisphaerales bacterium]
MLYLVATPIGNLADISQRAIDTLAAADYVASEDTRKTGRLLAHLEIKKPQISFHEHNEQRAVARIIGLLTAGRTVAHVTSAGTPGISDPGFTLVRAAIEAGIEVTMVPGPAACIAALVLSGLPLHSFTFRGFAPRKPGKRQAFFALDKDSPHTLLFYESPFRLRAFLQDAIAVFGDRRAALVKEITKLYETVKRDTISKLLAGLDEKPKGEYTIVIASAEEHQKGAAK